MRSTPRQGSRSGQRTDIGPPVTSGLPRAAVSIRLASLARLLSISLPGRLFFDAVINGSPIKHFIYSLNVDTGATTAGWPVDLNATAQLQRNSIRFSGAGKRGGLALVNGIVYSSYSGYMGDCGNYHGWVVGVDINNPSNVHGWATTALGGGIWGHSGVASDGTNMFVITGNTFNTGGNWMGGEAIIRLQAGPTWTGMPTDYWAPTIGSISTTATPIWAVSARY